MFFFRVMFFSATERDSTSPERKWERKKFNTELGNCLHTQHTNAPTLRSKTIYIRLRSVFLWLMLIKRCFTNFSLLKPFLSCWNFFFCFLSNSFFRAFIFLFHLILFYFQVFSARLFVNLALVGMPTFSFVIFSLSQLAFCLCICCCSR